MFNKFNRLIGGCSDREMQRILDLAIGSGGYDNTAYMCHVIGDLAYDGIISKSQRNRARRTIRRYIYPKLTLKAALDAVHLDCDYLSRRRLWMNWKDRPNL